MTPAEAGRIGRAWIAAGGDVRPGMRDTQGARLTDRHAWVQPDDWSPAVFAANNYSHLPDLRDAATRGAALEVVRERWGAPEGHLYPFERAAYPEALSWVFRRFYGADFTSEGDSEAAALLAALEAAPKVSP